MLEIFLDMLEICLDMLEMLLDMLEIYVHYLCVSTSIRLSPIARKVSNQSNAAPRASARGPRRI